jgi:hypothetical protein
MLFRYTLPIIIYVGLVGAFNINQPKSISQPLKNVVQVGNSNDNHISSTANVNNQMLLSLPGTTTKSVLTKQAAAIVTAMSLMFSVVLVPDAAIASDRAAQVSLDRIPPTTISIQIQDLPVVGNLISGYYTKVDKASFKGVEPSIVIQSPKDKIGAISAIAKGGHLEFDINGKISTHLDVDVAADEAGKLKVLVQSNLIPKLPFKNMASSAFTTPIVGGKESAWNIVTNLGTGESYYYNVKTGVTQYERPDRI